MENFTTTGGIEVVRECLARHLGVAVVIEPITEDTWEWAAKGSPEWGRITTEQLTYTRAARNVVGFAPRHETGYIVTTQGAT